MNQHVRQIDSSLRSGQPEQHFVANTMAQAVIDLLEIITKTRNAPPDATKFFI